MVSPALTLMVSGRKREDAFRGCGNRQGIIAATNGRVPEAAPISPQLGNA
jgi:hypothetical protein